MKRHAVPRHSRSYYTRGNPVNQLPKISKQLYESTKIGTLNFLVLRILQSSAHTGRRIQ